MKIQWVEVPQLWFTFNSRSPNAVHIALCFVVAFLEPRLLTFGNVDTNLRSEPPPPKK